MVPMMEGCTKDNYHSDDLVLYFHPYNFYSQKVLLVLYEKRISFTAHSVDLANGDQYQPWFLELNPRADVPVLQHGALIVSGSSSIINYLEEKFRGGKYKTLKPFNSKSREFEEMQQRECILGQIPVAALSLGSLIHDDLRLMPKPPFVGPIRKTYLQNNERLFDILRESVQSAPDTHAVLVRKLELQERRKRLVYSRATFQNVLDVTERVLRCIDDTMNPKANDLWLISSEFCLADISLGLLLYRLHQLGFEDYFWSNGKMPNVERYFHDFQERASYRKLKPSNLQIIRDVWRMTPTDYKVGVGAGFLGIAMIAFVAYRQGGAFIRA